MNDDINKLVKDTTKAVMSIREQRESAAEIVATHLDKLLKDSVDIFNIIGEYQSSFLDGKEKHMSFYYNTLDVLTGCYAYLAPITFTLKALEKNRSVRFFHGEKIACEKAGNKFVQGTTERESDFFVEHENYTANIFAGYLDSCMQAIQTCRVRIRTIETEERG